MTINSKNNGFNSSDYLQMIKIFAITLNEHREVMNSLNVFPVPDADTGTNMYMSVKGIEENIKKENITSDLQNFSKLVADLALMSAQGNSGLLIAQLFRGINDSVYGKKLFGVRELADALESCYKYANTSVHEPKEGTIITVMRECAKVAKKESKKIDANLKTILKSVSERAKVAVEETKNQMELLKKADVIDSGAYGFAIMLEALSNCIDVDSGHPQFKVDGNNSFVPQLPKYKALEKQFFQDTAHDEDWGFCTVFALSGEKLEIDLIKKELSSKGKSLVVSGNESVCKVHIHTENPDEIIDLTKKFGAVSNIDITNMDDQYKQMKDQISSQYTDDFSLVIITEGLEIETYLEKNTFGSLKIIRPSDLLRMSKDDLIAILDSVPSKNKILLPDSEESLAKIENLPSFIGDLIHIVRSKNIAEIVAAVLSFSPERNLNENILSMNDSISSCNSTFISMESVEENIKLERIFSKLDNYDTFKDSFISIYYSDAIPLEKAGLLKSFMTTELNVPEVELISVKTTLYDFLISIE
tara:strand:+ start:1082 stop:2674 length:1593 start_codon:yes stop_codon:yes gene_type:complete